MRVELKGINRARMKLADSSYQTYYYAWKGGPRLCGEPGSPEFYASYQQAAATKILPASGSLASVIRAYESSQDFKGLSARSQSDYVAKLKIIDKKFGDFPLAGLTDKRTRGIFKAWREKLAEASRRQADYTWSVLSKVLSFGVDNGLCDTNPCTRAGRLYRGTRIDNVWTDADEAAFLERAPSHLHLPFMLAIWTGQRQGDLLGLTWAAYDGTHIRMRQSKRGKRVLIRVGKPLKAMLDVTPKVSPIILTTLDGTPWTPDGFRASWRKACAKAGITGVTFNDLRGTAVTRLAIAGCEIPEIASLTGHSLKTVCAILDAHYLHRDQKLSESAILKLETRTNPPK
jgi:integrase